MSYYVLKHSAKGTTWGEHKYIRKEGNRYIYPEDVKKSANDNNVSNNEEIDKLLDEMEKSEKDLEASDEAISNVRRRIDELEGKFKFNANTGESSSALTDKEEILLYKLKNELLPELEKSRDEKHSKFILDRKYNEVREKYGDYKPTGNGYTEVDYRPATLKYNRNKEKLEDKRSQLLEQTKASAEKARIEREEKAKKDAAREKSEKLYAKRQLKKHRHNNQKYVIDTEDGGAFVTRSARDAIRVRNEVKQNKLKREDPIKYYLQRRKQKRK